MNRQQLSAHTMTKQSSISILLINHSENASEELVTVFRNSGRIARIVRAASAEEFLALLNSKHWDLLISDNQHSEVSIKQALEHLKKLQLDLPLIAISDDQETAREALESGAADVVGHSDHLQLTHAASREITAFNQRRELSEAKQKLSEAEQRAELLLSESSTAVAYITDGMVVGSNDAFCQQFGYGSQDDIDCAPVIDLIAAKDKDTFKSLLKAQPSRAEQSTDMECAIQLQNGDSVTTSLQLSNTIVDEEHCIQISLHSSGHCSADAGMSTADGFSQDYINHRLDSAIVQVQASHQASALLLVRITKLLSIRDQKGLDHAQQMAQEVSQLIKKQLGEEITLAKICDDSIAVLLAAEDADQALNMAESLGKALSGAELETAPNLTLASAVSVLAIDGSVSNAPELLDFLFLNNRKQNDDSVNIYAPPRTRKALGDAKSDDELDSVLEEALEDGQFWLTFQPLTNIRGASGDHYEVKVRMSDADGNELVASDFLQSLNFSNINTRLDRWVLLEASKRLAEQNNKDIRLLINLTPHSLHDESLLTWLGVALKAGDINPESLLLQFQEHDVIDNLSAAQQFAKNLKETGCQLSISSFGYCEEPLNTLQTINPHFIRIHRQYTEELQHNGDAQLLKALVSGIAESGAKTVITAVDHAAVMAQLWQLGVDFIQGNYLAPPGQDMDYEFTDIA